MQRGISIHALREEGDYVPGSPPAGARRFLSTPSARRATYVVYIVSRAKNFYPRPPRGGRPVHSPSRGSVVVFLSTPSARRATFEPTSERYIPSNYFYPRPPRGGRLADHRGLPSGQAISIHALREEGDNRNYVAPRLTELFLSTPSARRATLERSHQGGARPISIHALCEEGDQPDRSKRTSQAYFYPRPPRGGRLAALVQ